MQCQGKRANLCICLKKMNKNVHNAHESREKRGRLSSIAHSMLVI